MKRGNKNEVHRQQSWQYRCRDHKRTWQGVSAELIFYLYKLQVVYANII